MSSEGGGGGGARVAPASSLSLQVDDIGGGDSMQSAASIGGGFDAIVPEGGGEGRGGDYLNSECNDQQQIVHERTDSTFSLGSRRDNSFSLGSSIYDVDLGSCRSRSSLIPAALSRRGSLITSLSSLSSLTSVVIVDSGMALVDFEGDATATDGTAVAAVTEVVGAITPAVRALNAAAAINVNSDHNYNQNNPNNLSTDELAVLREELGRAAVLIDAHLDNSYTAGAILLLERSCIISSRLSGADHPDTLTLLFRRALCFVECGNYEQAMTLFEECLEKRTLSLGPSHEDTLDTANSLANCYRSGGDYHKARKLFEECLEKMRILDDASSIGRGREDSHTSSNCNSNGNVSSSNGSEETGARGATLEFRLKLFGVTNNLANIYSNLREFDKANELYEECLISQKEILCDSHPSIIDTLHNMSILYRERGDFAREYVYLEELLSKQKCGYVNDDSLASKLIWGQMVDTTRRLARNCDQRKDFGKARGLFEECLRMQQSDSSSSAVATTTFGGESNDPAITSLPYLTTQLDLANLLQNYRYFAKAEAMYKELLPRLKNLSGGDAHALAMEVIYQMGCNIISQDREEKMDVAQMFLQDCLVQRTAALGSDHHDTILTSRALAKVYAKKRDFLHAITLLKDILRLMQDRNPNPNPNSNQHSDSRDEALLYLSCEYDLATCYYKNGEYANAEGYFLSCYNKRNKSLGSSHIDTLSCLHDLATNHTRQGQLKEALALYEECFKRRSAVLSDIHPATLDTLRAMKNVKESLGIVENDHNDDDDDDSNIHGSNSKKKRKKKKKGEDDADSEW